MKCTNIRRFTRRYLHAFLIFFIFFVAGSGVTLQAQLISTDNYEVRALPDLWYNNVDGVIAGVRFRGEDPGTFLDGPHRIGAGIWLGTRFPDTPVSYSISYAHPIDAITGVNSEGSIRLKSSIRTGLHLHEAGIQKRWQSGFDEYVSTDFGITAGLYKRFDQNYVLYETLWQEDPVIHLAASLRRRDRNSLGRWTVSFSTLAGVPVTTDSGFVNFAGNEVSHPDVFGVDGLFGRVQLEALQLVQLPVNFQLRARIFGGFSTDALPPEMRYLPSDAHAMHWMESAFFRAKGTIPVSWMRSGRLHIPGGPGLRGYTFRTTELLENNLIAWIQHAMSINLDLDYPNPVNTYLTRVPYIGEILQFRTYLFTDAGLFYELSDWQDVQINAGAGFQLSFNIPDYLGQDRGFFVRYELPFWLSHVNGDEEHVTFRHLLGLGAQFRF